MSSTTLIKQKVRDVIKSIYDMDIDIDEISLEHPNDDKWGDYSTNIAFIIAKELKQSPIEIAKVVCYELNNFDFSFEKDDQQLPIFRYIKFATPGFLNFAFSEVYLLNTLMDIVGEGENFGKNHSFRTQKVLVEYTDPNPFKQFHIGHLMSNTIGESLSRILEFEGADLKRSNYQGDVGVHVAKSIWGMRKKLSDDSVSLQDVDKLPLNSRMDFLGSSYTMGDIVYDNGGQIKYDIDRLNYMVFKVAQDYLVEKEGWKPEVDYEKFVKDVGKDEINEVRRLYEAGRTWSLEYFESIYKRLGTKYDFYYFESYAGEIGYKLVHEFLDKGIFEEDEGAVILRGEKSGLHTRVFINSLGIPVYEAKELGLAPLKYHDFPYDLSLVVTGNEIVDYFKVLMKALGFINPELASKTRHVPHGMLRLTSGKMSSRTGKIITGETLIDEVKEVVLGKMDMAEFGLSKEEVEQVADHIAVAALKYDVLRRGIGRDVVFDKEQAISLTGNTGPYLQYTHARANSVLEKAKDEGKEMSLDGFFVNNRYAESIDEKELDVARHLYKFPEIVYSAARDLSPGDVCGYLFKLAQLFNVFYNDIRIINAGTEMELDARLYLTSAVKNVMKTGLSLLGIEAPNKI